MSFSLALKEVKYSRDEGVLERANSQQKGRVAGPGKCVCMCCVCVCACVLEVTSGSGIDLLEMQNGFDRRDQEYIRAGVTYKPSYLPLHLMAAGLCECSLSHCLHTSRDRMFPMS